MIVPHIVSHIRGPAHQSTTVRSLSALEPVTQRDVERSARLSNRLAIHSHVFRHNPNHSPSPPLVGIEPNPGPKGKGKPKGKPKTRSRRNRGSVPATMGMNNSTVPRMVSAPSSLGFSSSGSYLDLHSGKALKDVEFDNTSGAIRLVGSSLMVQGVFGNVTNAKIFFNGSVYTDFVYLSPVNLFGSSDRLINFTNVYQRYAFRRLKFTYVPSCPTTTPGSVFFGISRDADDVGTAMTLNTISDFNPSVSTPVWSPCSLEYDNLNGKKLWDTSTINVAEPANDAQGALRGVGSGTAASNALTFGYIRVDYIIDLYGPCPVRGSPSLTLAAYLRLKPQDRREFRALAHLHEDDQDEKTPSSLPPFSDFVSIPSGDLSPPEAKMSSDYSKTIKRQK